MENSSKPQERENPSTLNSPNSIASNNNNNTNIVNNGAMHIQSPKTITRSEASPYPTTFVQADTSNFKHVVQMLTGSSETAKQASRTNNTHQDQKAHHVIPPIKTAPTKQQGFRLYERRNQLKKSLMIHTYMPGYVQSSSKPDVLSPSMLDFPKLAINSPVTPLNGDPFNKNSPLVGSSLSSSEEEKAIAEKKFYLHPSPRTTPRDSEPKLLPLFPVESPKQSGSSS